MDALYIDSQFSNAVEDGAGPHRHGGLAAVKQMRRAKMFEKSDERILGDGDFVEQVLSAAEKQMKKRYRLQAKGYDLDKLASRMCDFMHLEPS